MDVNTTATVGFEKELWAAADKLRGSMDASEYKHVVLGLIFFKYISDRFEDRYNELVAEGEGFEEDKDEYKVVDIAAAVVGTVYLAAHTKEDNGSTDYTLLPNGDDEGGSTMNYSYGNSWFKSASDSDLDTEREKIRVAFCSAGDDFDLACELQELLWKFDAEMNERAWAGEDPHGPAFHREHGWYLPNDDD